MNRDQRNRLNTLLTRRRRKEDGRTLASRLNALRINYSFVADEVQDSLVYRLRSCGESLHDQARRVRFERPRDAFALLEQTADFFFPEASVFMPYDVDGGRAFLAPTHNMLRALEDNRSLISEDGFVLFAPDGNSGAILDYQDDDSPFEIELTLLGRMA